MTFISGHRVEEPDVGGPAERPGAASWEQPAREGSLPQEPALAAGAAGQQDLRADGAAGHPGQAAGEQLEWGGRRRNHHRHHHHRHQPALREAVTCMSALTSSPAHARQLEFCLCFSFPHVYDSCKKSMFTHNLMHYRYTHFCYGTRLHTSQVKQLCLDHAFPPLHSGIFSSSILSFHMMGCWFFFLLLSDTFLN